MTTKEERMEMRRSVKATAWVSLGEVLGLLDELDSKDAHIAAMQARIDGLEAKIDGRSK